MSIAHPRTAFLSVGAVAALLVAACGGGGGDPTPTPSATTTQAEPTATSPPSATATPAEPVLIEHEVDLDLPRSFVYGGQETTLRGAVISNATPGGVLDPEPKIGEEWHVYFDAVVGYEDGYPGRQDLFALDRYTLVLGDSTEIPAANIDFARRFPLRAGVPAEILLGFPVDEDEDFEDAVIVLADVGHRPARLPLTGPVPADAYPLALSIAGEAEVSIEGGCADGTAVVTLQSAEVDVDAGADHDNEPIAGAANPRALEGEAFLRIDVAVLATAQTCGGILPSDEEFRLSVDGLPVAPLNTDVELLNTGEGTEFTFGFVFEEDAELELLVGSPDGTVATFPVEVPELPGD